MKAKRFKIDIPQGIIGMTLDRAKIACITEGYVLQTSDKPILSKELHETYLITVTELDSDGKILKAKYGK
jgi:hypothetical protein